MEKSQEQTLRQLKAVVANPNWEIFEEYIMFKRDKLLDKLTQCRPEELQKLQGNVQTLDELLRLKEHMRDSE